MISKKKTFEAAKTPSSWTQRGSCKQLLHYWLFIWSKQLHQHLERLEVASESSWSLTSGQPHLLQTGRQSVVLLCNNMFKHVLFLFLYFKNTFGQLSYSHCEPQTLITIAKAERRCEIIITIKGSSAILHYFTPQKNPSYINWSWSGYQCHGEMYKYPQPFWAPCRETSHI